MRQVFAATFALTLWPIGADACEPVLVPASELDGAISLAPDGSFEVSDRRNAHDQGSGYFSFRSIRGGKAIDIGDGRVGQKLIMDYGCQTSEHLLFAECNTGNALLVAGEEVPDYILGGGYSSIARIQPPYGPIALTARSTVDEVAEIAEANGYSYTRDVMADPMTMARFQRYDPFIGCKLFYPDSPGARQ
jgi:hypothetical protein